MSNFKCDKCGMTNVDCGLGVFKTPREIELEKRVKELDEIATALNTRVTQQTEEKYNLNKDILKLEGSITKLKQKLHIAEEALNNIHFFDCDTCKNLKFKCDDKCDDKVDKIVEQALQKIKEI